MKPYIPSMIYTCNNNEEHKINMRSDEYAFLYDKGHVALILCKECALKERALGTFVVMRDPIGDR